MLRQQGRQLTRNPHNILAKAPKSGPEPSSLTVWVLFPLSIHRKIALITFQASDWLEEHLPCRSSGCRLNLWGNLTKLHQRLPIRTSPSTSSTVKPTFWIPSSSRNRLQLAGFRSGESSIDMVNHWDELYTTDTHIDDATESGTRAARPAFANLASPTPRIPAQLVSMSSTITKFEFSPEGHTTFG
ncbi:hypothetical protein BJ508DRAFT_23154 [Ascobolus immersus RN42]|uniref:Uncharacterized protein n=1 Tax=Ascobolus immersus RN42 TaxID=1160509 RepID=A0A3N4HN58_ASCIM|nr:hypothetical protein BJ508DRAFT_23154 [Ascobolus immersus RN42]